MMLANLLLGAVVISATVLIHSMGFIMLSVLTTGMKDRLGLDGAHGRTLAMVATVFGLFLVLTVEIWLWAFVHYTIGVLNDFETALYFSIVSFSTLGYGDVLPAHEWRILAGLEGINGFLLIGWSTAYLIAAGIRVGPFRTGEHF